MKFKTCRVTIKAAGTQDGTADGVFEALVATYDVDSVRDRIIKGAFAESLAEWEASGDPIPVYWSHRMDDPDYNIGHVEAAEETDEGLWVRGRLDMESGKAVQVYRLMKGRRVTQFSFAYDILDAAPGTVDGEDVLELRRLKLHEVGPTPIGANQRTELLDVKHGVNVHVHAPAQACAQGETTDDPAGNTGPVEVDGIQGGDLVALVKKVVADVLSSRTEGDDGKATPTPPAVSAEPAGSDDYRPARSGTAAFCQRLDAERMLLGIDISD